MALQWLVRDNWEDWLWLVIDEDVQEEVGIDLSEMIFFGGHGGSVGYAYNFMWHKFMRKLREYEGYLPEDVLSMLDWLKETHGW